MRLRKNNKALLESIGTLKKASRTSGARIWATVGARLESSGRGQVLVNLSRLNRHVGEGETAVVPGKVLGSGGLDHAITVAAFGFSEVAAERIKEAGGRPLTIQELLRENPKGSGVKLIA